MKDLKRNYGTPFFLFYFILSLHYIFVVRRILICSVLFYFILFYVYGKPGKYSNWYVFSKYILRYHILFECIYCRDFSFRVYDPVFPYARRLVFN